MQSIIFYHHYRSINFGNSSSKNSYFPESKVYTKNKEIYRINIQSHIYNQ